MLHSASVSHHYWILLTNHYTWNLFVLSVVWNDGFSYPDHIPEILYLNIQDAKIRICEITWYRLTADDVNCLVTEVWPTYHETILRKSIMRSGIAMYLHLLLMYISIRIIDIINCQSTSLRPVKAWKSAITYYWLPAPCRNLNQCWLIVNGQIFSEILIKIFDLFLRKYIWKYVLKKVTILFRTVKKQIDIRWMIIISENITG